MIHFYKMHYFYWNYSISDSKFKFNNRIMKLKFFLLTFLLLFARGCDFYSTSLWFFQPDGPSGETNPLVRIFGFGFTGLVVTNIIIVGLMIYAFYYYSFKYTTPKVPTKPLDLATLFLNCILMKKGGFMMFFTKHLKTKKYF